MNISITYKQHRTYQHTLTHRDTHRHTRAGESCLCTMCILKMAAWHVYEITTAAAEQPMAQRCQCSGTYIYKRRTISHTMCIVSTTIEFHELHFSLELVVLLSYCVYGRRSLLRFVWFNSFAQTKLEHTKHRKKTIIVKLLSESNAKAMLKSNQLKST